MIDDAHGEAVAAPCSVPTLDAWAWIARARAAAQRAVDPAHAAGEHEPAPGGSHELVAGDAAGHGRGLAQG